MSKFRQQHMSIMWHEISDKDSDIPAVKASLHEKAGLVGRVGLMLLSVGAGAFRVRAAMNKISRALNITCNADIGIKSVEYTCIEGAESCTNALSNVTYGVNTDKLHLMEMFCDGFSERADKYSIDRFHKMLDTIQKGKGNYNTFLASLASGAACAAFAFLLGGHLIDIICSFFAAAVGFGIRKELIKRHLTLFANTSIAVLASCLIYIGLINVIDYASGAPFDYQAGYICSVLFLIPGFPLITGGIDLAKLDLRSGIERITYAFLVIFVASTTAAFAASLFDFCPEEFTVYEINETLRYLLIAVTSFIGVFGFSVLFNSTPRMAATAGIIGMFANTFRMVLINEFGIGVNIAAFCGALLAGLLASSIKRFIGFPRITLTVPSIVIMVPGMFMYKGVYYISTGMFSDGLNWLGKALIIVVSLPLGLVFARIITDRNFRQSS